MNGFSEPSKTSKKYINIAFQNGFFIKFSV